MLSHAILSGVGLSEPSFIVPPQPDRERRKRILAALGLTSKRQPGLARRRADAGPLLRVFGGPVGIAVRRLLSVTVESLGRRSR